MKGVLGFVWPVLILLLLIAFRFWYQQQTNPIGERLYTLHCANCHMEQGQGLAKLIPPLANADYLITYREQIPCIIRNGMQGEIVVNGTTYNHPMPGNDILTETEIYHIIDYINHSWENDIEEIPGDSIDDYLKKCVDPKLLYE